MAEVRYLSCSLTILFIVSAINNTAGEYDEKSQDGRLVADLGQFLSEVNSIMSKYKASFKVSRLPKDRLEESDIKIIMKDSFSGIALVDKDKIVIDTRPGIYEKKLKDITVTAAKDYSAYLMKQVRDLAKMQATSKEINQERRKLKTETMENSSAVSNGVEHGESSGEQDKTKADNEEIEDEDEAPEKDSSPVTGHSDDDITKESSPPVGDIPANQITDTKDADIEAEEMDSTEDTRETQENSPDKKTPAVTRASKRAMSPSVNSSQHKRFQNIAVNLINSIQEHRFSSPFLQAVNKKEASDYYDLIYEPKDLKNILKSIKSKHDPPEYNSVKQLERDIMLMFANCVMYNQSNESLVDLTISMRDDVSKMFELFEEAEQDIK